MDLIKMNCWEFKNCGRQPGGYKVEELGVCPVYTETSADGINKGTNAGRACWAVAGTLCGGKVQGEYAQKIKNCESCNFYQIVHLEEKEEFVPSELILAKLKQEPA